MTLYLDTSALLKLYIGEEHTPLIRTVAAKANKVTSLMTYVEARSAFGRRRREGSFSIAVERQFLDQFERDWHQLQLVDVTELLVRQAGALAVEYQLRAYDAIHLASALELQTKLGQQVTFAAFDTLLNRAAKKAGLKLMVPTKQQ